MSSSTPDRILYVDDEEALLDITRAFLERAGGITVDTTASPLKAFQMIMTGRYDAVVSDYQMPEMDGIGLLKQIREAGSRVPFIIFTGRGREQVAIEALNNGADFYLQKGGDPKTQYAELANAVRQLAGRRRAEAALHKSQETLHKAQSLAHLGSWEFDPGTGRLTWSEEAYRILGLNPGEDTPTYEGFLSIVHPDDRAMFDTTYFASIADGKDNYEIEHRIIRADTRDLRYLVERCEHQRDESGRITRSVGMVHDITDRKLIELELLRRHNELQAAYEQLASVEEELRTSFDDLAEGQHRLKESERRLADIIEFLPDATFVIDTGGHVIAWNRAIEKMTGVLKAEMLGRGDYAYAVPFYGEARPVLFDYVLRPDRMAGCPYHIRAGNGEVLEGEVALARPGGRDAILMIRASPLYDREGRRAGAIEIVRDITEQKQVEADLRETKEYLENLIDHANAPIVVWNPECIITRFNRAFEHLTGIPADEAIGQNLETLFPEESRNASMGQIRRAMAGELWEDVEIPIVHRSGSVRTVLWNSANIVGSDGETPVATIAQGQDITIRKQAETELLQKHEELQAAYEQLASIEEELRTSFDDLAESQRQLRESEELYRRISESISDVVFVCDFQDTGEYAIGRIAGAVHEITGYTDDEVLAMRCWKHLVHPDDMPIFEREIRSLSPNMSSAAELRIVHRDGSARWIRVSANCTNGQNGGLRLYGGWQDITDQKEAEEALRESEWHFRTLADSGQALIWTSGLDANCDYFNEPWLAFTGRTLEQELGDGWTEGVHPDDLSRCIETYLDAFARRERFSMAYRLRRHDGEYRWIQDDGSPRYDTHGNFLGYIGHCLDVTEQRRMEEALRETAEKMESIFRVAPTGIGVAVDGLFTEVNDRLCEITGYTRDELIGQSVRLFYPSDEEYESAMQEIIAGVGETGTCTLEARSLCKDGGVIIVQLSITPLDSTDISRGTAFTIQDITERKAIEQEIIHHASELARQTNSLTVANRKLNLMNSITRHDILNQLTILLGNLSFAEEAEPGQDVSVFLARVKNAADRIRRQIEFTRDYTDLGDRFPEWQQVSDAIRKEALHGLPVDDEAGNLVIYADPMLAAAFSNLMDNTIRHGESATRVRVWYRPEENGDLTLVWEDDGVGIPAEEKERIFERNVGKNTGLGLFLIREILGITGISITETGEPGKGARFEMLIPHGAYRL
ncbi:MAG: hypothetical protein CVV35_00735 [Methanomicrobiales archaeon HGW-Methanomicrobiales-6]|jgi:PAS domain S-box-containing protein|nr:MAG: hypothetical protein CVV35_00735 [Methanomicrobiales archaeon HGW-Methanomicrobiales-6]